MSRLSKRSLTDSYDDAHKISSLTQISILNKNLRSDFKYDIVFIMLGSKKSSGMDLRMGVQLSVMQFQIWRFSMLKLKFWHMIEAD